MNQHSIIDSFPKVLLEFDHEEIEKNASARSESPPDLCQASIASGSTRSNASAVCFTGLIMSRGKQKIDQDVDVFKGIAATLRPKALFHLLRGAELASADEFIPEQNKDGDTDVSKCCPGRHRVRFEPDLNNQNGFVKCYIKKIPKITDPSLWWQREDLQNIRSNVGTVVETYRRYHKDYEIAIVQLLDYYSYSTRKDSRTNSHNSSATIDSGNTKKKLLTEFRQALAKNDVARGLEMHIIRALEKRNQDHFDSVYWACHENSTDDRAIRQACLVHSKVSHRMAHLFAKSDTKEALACVFTSWRPRLVGDCTRPPIRPTRSSDSLLHLAIVAT